MQLQNLVAFQLDDGVCKGLLEGLPAAWCHTRTLPEPGSLFVCTVCAACRSTPVTRLHSDCHVGLHCCALRLLHVLVHAASL